MARCKKVTTIFKQGNLAFYMHKISVKFVFTLEYAGFAIGRIEDGIEFRISAESWVFHWRRLSCGPWKCRHIASNLILRFVPVQCLEMINYARITIHHLQISISVKIWSWICYLGRKILFKIYIIFTFKLSHCITLTYQTGIKMQVDKDSAAETKM